MFYELIYTRCGSGIDILKKGHQQTGEGFKVYSCSPEILEDGKLDLHFFENTAKSKQSFSVPGFMEDAYLYCVPECGSSFLVNFHPVPFDAKAEGGFTKRPGNFVNQVFAGDFSCRYPFELFREEKLWDAKTRGEAYYYENPPAPLVARDISSPSGVYVENIAAFIKDDREEALAKAVGFLLAQYAKEPENRKYVVIRDDNAEKIEMWVAAILSAFSPRLASKIPFATRMDKFACVNEYTVDASGAYQTAKNLQDPKQSRRWRAMIVGADARDRANIGAARAIANSPFVLLDGKEKKALFDADTSHGYFSFISRFDEEHMRFCREFLQSFDLPLPGNDVLRLYEAFAVLAKPNPLLAKKMLAAFETLGKYRSADKKALHLICANILGTVVKFMQDDISEDETSKLNSQAALALLKLFRRASEKLGQYYEALYTD